MSSIDRVEVRRLRQVEKLGATAIARRIEFEVRNISQHVNQQSWAVWEPCLTVYSHVMSSDDPYGVRRKGDFSNMVDVLAASFRVGDSAKSCLDAALNKPIGLSEQVLVWELSRCLNGGHLLSRSVA